VVLVQVVDNFLSVEELKKVQNIIFSDEFPFYWNGRVNRKNSGEDITMFYFTHNLFDGGINSPFYRELNQIFYSKMDIKVLDRMKVNLYTGMQTQIEHGYHKDRKWSHKGAIFSLNTCDGYTKFKDGTKVDSVENRMLFFDPSIEHTSANTTDSQRRVNINFNYF
tara:strand:+ start:150 stop:644 length:495 start_codon:yes stop_codon:yes gene_type:complete